MTQASDPILAPIGCRVEALMLVHQIERRVWGEGREGTILVLGTHAGRIGTAPLWGERQAWAAGIACGTIVAASGRIGAFRGVRQLELAALHIAPADAVPLRMLMPGTTTTAADWTLLDEARGAVRRPRLRRVLGLFYDDPAFRSAYEECPASTMGHHARLGGLLQHTVEVATIGRAVALASGADRELVLAGEAAPLCSSREVLLLQHLVASHHGLLEHGAPVRPMTLEAEVLHYADDASAKTSSMAEVLASPEHFVEQEPLSTRSIWQVDHRRVFRGRSEWGAGKSESVERRR